MDNQPISQRGSLKVFIGYAAGVGKTYRMLEEGHDLKAKGVDVVVGYFEPHARPDTIAKAKGLEMVPRRKIEYRGTLFHEMDAEAVLRRRPEVCLVDELAHTNVPGTERAKRWEDVLVLLEAGITVITTMNIQHLESLTDQVRQITGIQVRETVPDWVMKQADEIVMVDLPPLALIHRLQRGVVYSHEKAAFALQNFFKESNLVALREMALRQAAHEVNVRQTEGLQEASSTGSTNPLLPHRTEKVVERFLVHVTDQPSTALLIRRTWRVADYLQAECFAVYVQPPVESRSRKEAIEKHLKFARDLHIETRVLEGEDVAETLVQFARVQRITHIFMTRPRLNLWQRLLRGDLIRKVIRMAHDMRVSIVADRTSQPQGQSLVSVQGT
jgi:two-component system, OmpR family, sensor histidine kinase KdpD